MQLLLGNRPRTEKKQEVKFTAKVKVLANNKFKKVGHPPTYTWANTWQSPILLQAMTFKVWGSWGILRGEEGLKKSESGQEPQ